MTKVIVKDNAGNIVSEFEANSDESLGTQMQEAGAPIPFSCGVGACRTCVCQTEKGLELVDKEAVGPMHIMVEDNEFLSCIAGVNPEETSGEIVLVAENL